MRNTGIAILTMVGLAAIGVACAPAGDDGSASAAAAVDDLVRRWDEAMASGEAERALALYVEDGAAAMAPDRAAYVGATGIGVLFRNMFENGGIEVADRVEQVLSSGDLVIARGSYTLAVADDSGAGYDETGKWVAVTRRNPDGSLSVRRNLWNRDAAPPGTVGPPAFVATESPAAADDAECLDGPSALDRSFVDHWALGEIPTLVAHHTEQASRMPPGRPIVTGRAQIGADLQAFGDLFKDRRLLLQDAGEEIEGNLGFSWGRYHISYIFAGDEGARIEGQGKFLAVATRGKDGCWRHEWVIWNDDAPWPAAGS